jgi:hypothetical protein
VKYQILYTGRHLIFFDADVTKKISTVITFDLKHIMRIPEAIPVFTMLVTVLISKKKKFGAIDIPNGVDFSSVSMAT